MAQLNLVSGSGPIVIDVMQKETTSVVCTPDSAVYSVKYSCSPVKGPNINWVSEDTLANLSTQKSVEFGRITKLQFTLVSGTSVSIDIT